MTPSPETEGQTGRPATPQAAQLPHGRPTASPGTPQAKGEDQSLATAMLAHEAAWSTGEAVPTPWWWIDDNPFPRFHLFGAPQRQGRKHA